MSSYQVPPPFFPWAETEDEKAKRLLNNQIYQQVDDSLSSTTRKGQPYWASDKPIPAQMVPPTLDSNQIAAVNLPARMFDPSGDSVQVMSPKDYTPAVAAHEATHVFQNTRNDDFNRQMNRNFEGVPTAQTYDYKLRDLLKTGGKSIGNYNREQQARMVEDLTDLQSQYKAIPRPSSEQLQTWDTLKQSLERPIRQLTNIPAQDTSIPGRIEHEFSKIGLGGPASYIRDMLSLPLLKPTAPPSPEVPSLASGRIQPSSLVRDVTMPSQERLYATIKKTGERLYSVDGGSTWISVKTGRQVR